LSGLRTSLRLALLPSVVASATALLAALLTRDLTSSVVLVALTVSTGATIVVSTMQDHVRRLLHIAEMSWKAAAVSGIQLLAISVAIPTLMALDIERAWIPFGSLCIANISSVTFGLLAAGVHRQTRGATSLRFRELAQSGKWLVLRAAIPSGAAFIAANVLTRLAGPVAYGHAEAARQVAQPVTVLALGLSAILGPRAVRAGMQTDTGAARKTRLEYGFAVVGVAAAYALLTGVDWALNPMSYLVPSAYDVRWLVPATVLANAIAAMVMLFTSELLGAGRARQLALLALVSSPALLLAAATAGTTGAFARPLGFVIEGSIVLFGANWWLRRHYAEIIPGRMPEEVNLEGM
jgi:hypothetical protein